VGLLAAGLDVFGCELATGGGTAIGFGATTGSSAATGFEVATGYGFYFYM
jgi:hypothetical protein